MHSVSACKNHSQHPNSFAVKRSQHATRFINCLLKCALAFACFTSCSFGQDITGNFEHGTVVIVAFRHGHLIAAADSSLLNGLTGSFYVGCKIAQLGQQGFFVINGISGVPNHFYGPDLAKELFQRPRAMPFSAGKDGIADAWGKLMISRFNRTLIQSDFAVARELKTSGIFGFGDVAGHLYLYEVHLIVSGERPKQRMTYSVEEHFADDNREIEYGPSHSTAIMHEQMAEGSRRARIFNRLHPIGNSPDKDFDALFAARTLEAVIEWNPKSKEISMPVAAVTLDPGQPLRWVKKCADGKQ